ncbi:HAD superfamily hydrolase (TIGR01490 family) [Sediminihabitans luteus]|uniref:HAD superfamily hydrolase (TIGR01490 family) n=1 Tax=Sediminihabitans luteus TaxID=1138585 RepID=A0A2M9D085_9CELL|nr:HAD-IB family hydrolase [Sediminihabitans luteus]PJJ77557.1 HAD superfamily hydrolase (TIGR01490 family) [Sediminihabitans luteus]GII98457.1 morphological differentiation-associated protein [Sediminihabitans luteus]
MTEHAATTPPPTAPGTPGGRVAAFFDLDKTIIATSSAAAFSRPFLRGGLLSRGDALRSAYTHFLFMLGSADADQTERMRAMLSTMVTGWDVATVSRIVAETLHEHIDPVVYAEAVALIEKHHAQGHDVVVVSASGAELVDPIAAVLGADHAIATRMTVADGAYTGEIEFYAYGPYKAEAIERLAAAEGYDLAASYAYSDSVTDAPMLAIVGHPAVVNPDRGLRRVADENGWEVLRFVRPVRLRPVVRPVPTAIVVGTAVAAVAGVLVWRAVRRRSARGQLDG